MASKCSFVLLAGGKSSRMGVAKGLLKYKQTFWILEQLRRIEQGGITNVYIGLGYDTVDYFTAIPWLQRAVSEDFTYSDMIVRVVVNPHPEFGPFSTLQTVLNVVGSDEDILVCPVDVPICNAGTLKTILAVDNKVVLLACNNKHGHPVKIAPVFWNEFLKLRSDDPNARLDYQIKSLDSKHITTISVNDEQVTMNLNTVKGWKLYLTR